MKKNITYRAAALLFFLATLFITHSSLFASGTDAPHDGSKSIGCLSCHDLASSESKHIPPMGHTPQNIDDTVANNLCWSCHENPVIPPIYVETHSSLSTSDKYGQWAVACWVCHNQHLQDQDNAYGTNYGKYIRKKIDLAEITGVSKTGSRDVRFTSATGLNSFADGDATIDGICEVCHTQTNHFRNTGEINASPSGSDHTSYAGTNCTTCHSHSNGFAHGGGTGTDCVDCHGHDAGTLFDPDMASPYTPGSTASPGYGSFQSHSTHTETDTDDLKGPGLYCDDCHDTSSFPDFKDGKDLSTTTVCDACHSKGGTYDGIDDPVIGAKTLWRTGAYVATDDSTLRVAGEKWCAGCHDESAAVIATITAPNVIGDEDGSYIYGTGWGYYKTGHGLVIDETYPSKGGIETLSGRAVECNACHDFSTAHIDGDARSFDCSDGCDPAEYRQGYRLRLVGGEEPLVVPWTGLGGSSADKFRICTQAGCHSSSPFTDPSSTETNFYTWTARQVPAGSGNWVDFWENRHEYHLNFPNQNRYPADYNYGGAYNSRITCVNCHNVHGSTSLAMVRDGKLIGREPGLKIWYDNPDIVTFQTINTNPPVPENVPLSASTGTIWRGGTSANLCTHCHANNNTLPECRDSDDPSCSAPDPPFQADAMQAPTLNWTGEAGFTIDGASPDSGTTGNIFTFRVKYADSNNDPPSLIQVWIDEDNNGYDPVEKHIMAEVDAGDTNYVDGKLYEFSLVLTNIGGNLKSYRFYASDGTDPAVGPPAADGSVYIFNTGQGSGSLPVLDWTGETGFVADGIQPDSGMSTDSFEFRTKYSDAENDAPALIELWIDRDLNNAYSLDEKITLTKIGAGTNYVGGEIYTSGVIPLSCGDGCSMDYRFYATDGSNEAVSNEPVQNSQVYLGNNVPLLSWTGETDYVSDGVDPESAAGGSSFTFRVDYADDDNTAPRVIQVWVDLDNSKTFDDSEKIAMAEVDAGDTDYVDGKLYSRTIEIPHVGDGIVSYRFHGKDGADEAAGEPILDKTLETTPPAGNNAPVLSWYTADCLTNGVRPETGANNTDFEFMVTYTDSDNQCAGTIQVWVDENDNSFYGPGEKYELIERDPLDVDCTDGKTYGIANTLTWAGDGTLNYRFFATDGKEAATGSPVSNAGFTVIRGLKVRPTGGTGWYATVQEAVDASGDPSTILVYPNSDFTAATYTEDITVQAKNNRTLRSACGADFTTISGTGTALLIQSSNVEVDGFTFTGGGTGVYVNIGTSVTVKNNKMHTNSYGMYVNNGATVDIDNNEIYNNSIRGIHTNAAATAAHIVNCDIHNNGLTGSGAGIYFNGGVHTISDSMVRNNSTSADGGGVLFMATGAGTTLTNTSIMDNQTTGGTGRGGGLHVNAGQVALDKCTITGNQTLASTGGGIYILNGGSNVEIKNSIIASNSALRGGAAYLHSGTVSFINDTIADNQATAGNGGAFAACNLVNNTVHNSIFWNNTATGVGNNAYKECGGGFFMTVTHSDISTAPGFIDGGSVFTDSNIDPAVDPSFVGGGDYHLQGGSPVIDQANATYAPPDDIDGDIRPNGVLPDMGADEYYP